MKEVRTGNDMMSPEVDGDTTSHYSGRGPTPHAVVRANRKGDRMLKRLAAVIAACAMALSMVAAVNATAYTQNLAGRPMNGDASSNSDNACHGTGYGQVNGQPVLFTAAHCVSNDHGAPWYDPTGRKIGYVNSSTPSAATAHDLDWINLFWGSWPSNPNQVYRGRNSLGEDLWFTNTGFLGNPALDCGSISASFGGTVYQAFHKTSLDHTLSPSGTLVGWWDSTPGSCRVLTTLNSHSGYKDSGSPFFMNQTTIGVATAQTSAGKLIFSPISDGIRWLNTYYTTNGYTLGANLCTTSDCGGYMP